MSLPIDNAALEARIRQEMLVTGATSAEELLERLLDLRLQLGSVSAHDPPTDPRQVLDGAGHMEMNVNSDPHSAAVSREEMKALLEDRFHLISQKYVRNLEKAEIDRLQFLDSQLRECDRAEAEADRRAFSSSPAGRLKESLDRLEEYIDRLSAGSK